MIWIVVSILAGVFSVGFWTVISQLLAGLFAVFGGRRTDAGMQAYTQVLGLRRYLRRVSREDLQRSGKDMPWLRKILGSRRARQETTLLLTVDSNDHVTFMRKEQP